MKTVPFYAFFAIAHCVQVTMEVNPPPLPYVMNKLRKVHEKGVFRVSIPT